MQPQLILAINEWPSSDHSLNTKTANEHTSWILDTQSNCWKTVDLSDIESRYRQEDSANGKVSATVFIPSQHVLCSNVAIPKKQQRHLDKILPFLCEEKIASDIDDVHIATGAIQAEKASIRVIEKETLESLLSYFERYDIRALQVFCDSDLVLENENLLWLDSDIACLITNNKSVTTNALNAVTLIDSWYDTQVTDALEPLNVFINSAEPSTEVQLTIDQWRSQNAQIHITTNTAKGATLTESLWLLRERFKQDKPSDSDSDLINPRCINLLSGPYQPQSLESQSGRWRAVVQAACILLAFNFIYLLGSGLYWQRQADQVQAKNEALYREYFPQDRRIVNIKTQTLNHLQQQSTTSDNGALRLLSELLPSWQEHKRHITLKSLRYQQQRNEVLLEVDAKSIGRLDQLRQSLGDRAELLSANEDGDRGANGRLKYKGEHL